MATEYLNYLYSDEAQEIEAENYFRPTNEKILKEHSDVFDLSVDLVNISEYGGWDEVQKKHFGDGGIFDRFTSDKNRCNHDPGCGNYRPIITGHKIEHEDNTTRTYETERW